LIWKSKEIGLADDKFDNQLVQSDQIEFQQRDVVNRIVRTGALHGAIDGRHGMSVLNATKVQPCPLLDEIKNWLFSDSNICVFWH
jgi:hypothetical protein